MPDTKWTKIAPDTWEKVVSGTQWRLRHGAHSIDGHATPGGVWWFLHGDRVMAEWADTIDAPPFSHVVVWTWGWSNGEPPTRDGPDGTPQVQTSRGWLDLQ